MKSFFAKAADKTSKFFQDKFGNKTNLDEKDDKSEEEEIKSGNDTNLKKEGDKLVEEEIKSKANRII